MTRILNFRGKTVFNRDFLRNVLRWNSGSNSTYTSIYPAISAQFSYDPLIFGICYGIFWCYTMELLSLLLISAVTNLTLAINPLNGQNDDTVSSCISPEVAQELIKHFNDVNYMLIAILVFGAMMLLLFMFFHILPKLAGGFTNKRLTKDDLIR